MKKLTDKQCAGMTKSDICKKYFLETFDFALPQGWLNEVTKAIEELTGDDRYHYVMMNTVWNYPEDNSLVGEPFFLTQEAADLVGLVS